LAHGRARGGAVARGPLERDRRADAALVRDGHSVPTGGFADHAPVRSGERRAVPRAFARRRLLLDCADDGDAHTGHTFARRGDERGERPLRIDGTTADELVALDAYRDLAGHGVDVAEQHDVPWT